MQQSNNTSANIFTPDEPEQADLDALAELQRSRGFALVIQRMQVFLDEERNELEKPAGDDRTNVVRGRIQAIRTVLDIPQILKDELTKKK